MLAVAVDDNADDASVVDIHACKLAVAVNDKAELASLLSLRLPFCRFRLCFEWAFLPAD